MNDRSPFLAMPHGTRLPVRLPGLLLLVLLGLSLRPGVVQAQEAQQITFNEAVRIALTQNVALKRAANIVEARAITTQQRRMNFFPNLSLNSDAGQTFGRQFSQAEARIVNQSRDLSAGLNSEVNIFNGFNDVNALKQSRLQYEGSEYDFERQRQTVVFNVMSNFLQLIQRREQIDIQEENLEAQRQLLAQIEEFVNVGTRPISDLYQQQAAVAQAELSLLDATQAFQLAELNLIQVLQLDPFGQYEFVAPELAEEELPTQEYDVRAMLQNAFVKRPDLQAREYDIQAARTEISLARSSFWPRFGLRGSYGTYWSDIGDAGFRDQFLDNNLSGSIAVSLSLPIWDRNVTRNNVQQAEVQLKNARLDLENLQQEIALQVRQAYLDYETAEKSLDVAQKQVRAAELALEASQERYNVGAATLVELSQQRASFVQAAGDLVRAQYNLVFQEKLIDYYLGVLDPSQPLFE